MDPRRGKTLRYKADRFGVAYVVALFTLQIAIWALAPAWWAAIAILPLALFGIFSAPINHNHQHVNVFHSKILNRGFDLLLALQTGVGPYSWVLHHNLGHHMNYLTQRPHRGADESGWKRDDGTTMLRFEYALRLFFSHPVDIRRVGRKHPRIYKKYLLMRIPLYGILATLACLQPMGFVFVFVIPPLLTLFHTCWVTYEHHAGLHSDEATSASFNRENRIYNVLSHNLGYHTAHHMRPGIHWSLLPEFHERIRKDIPDRLITRAFW